MGRVEPQAKWQEIQKF